MMKIKHMLVIMASGLLAFSLTSCGGDEPADNATSNSGNSGSSVPNTPDTPDTNKPVQEALKGYWHGASDINLNLSSTDSEGKVTVKKQALLQFPNNYYPSLVADNGQAAFVLANKGNNLGPVWTNGIAYLLLGDVHGDKFVGKAYDMTKHNDGDSHELNIYGNKIQIPMKNTMDVSMQFLPIDVQDVDEQGHPKKDSEGQPVMVKDNEFKEFTNLSFDFAGLLDSQAMPGVTITADKVARLSHKNLMNQDSSSVQTAAKIKNGKLQPKGKYNCHVYTDGKALTGKTGSSLGTLAFETDDNLNIKHTALENVWANGADCSIDISTTPIAETSADNANSAESMPSQYKATASVSACVYGVDVGTAGVDLAATDFEGLAFAYDGNKLNIYMASSTIQKPLVLACTK